MHIADNFYVLLGQSLRTVHHQKTDVAAPHGVEGAHITVILHAVVHILFFADSRRIDERILLSVPLEQRIDGVPRRSRHGRDNAALRPQKPVYQTGFSRIGFPHHGNF